jgi:hypothetical protein
MKRILTVALACCRTPPTPRTRPPVLLMANLSIPPTTMYFTPSRAPTLAAVCGLRAPDVASPCSFITRFNLSRSTITNFDESAAFSENSVSRMFRAAGPISL